VSGIEVVSGYRVVFEVCEGGRVVRVIVVEIDVAVGVIVGEIVVVVRFALEEFCFPAGLLADGDACSELFVSSPPFENSEHPASSDTLVATPATNLRRDR
jgi:hypothetical protein